MRLQKYIAQCGIASRRKAEEMIGAGRVSVNGSVVMTQGLTVDENTDNICVDGREIHIRKNVYYLLNKPEGYVCTAEDPHAKQIITDLLPKDPRLYPVGRLDKDTEGLIILTNDGDLTFKLTHPSHEFEKTYIAKVRGRISDDALRQLKNGVTIDHNDALYTTSPAKVRLLGQKPGSSMLEITIHEGKNRQIRKMCEAVGFPVMCLKRIALGMIYDHDLISGQWRSLTFEEVAYLKGC